MESGQGYLEDNEIGVPQKVRGMDLVDAYMGNAVCSATLLETIEERHPVTRDDERARRYVVYALFGLCDNDTGLPLLGKSTLEWIDGKPFRGDRWGEDVLRDLRETFPKMGWRAYVPKHKPRLLQRDGLHADVRSRADEERRSGQDEVDRPVFAVTGEAFDRRVVSENRKAMVEMLEAEELDAPSETARYVMHRMNHRAPNVFTRHVVPQLAEARKLVASLDVKDEDLRDHYYKVLRHIERQPQPFYKPSGRGRTDRIFPANPSALSLPKRVRDVLSRRFVQVDLKSAHLFIGAALWGCQEALIWLQRPGYNIWNELWSHFQLDWYGREYWPVASEFKAACKEAVYSTLYGMEESYVRGQFTRSLGDVLEPVPLIVASEEGACSMHEYAARHLVRHPVISALLEARDRELERIEREGGAETATGIRVETDPDEDVNAASVLATVAQSYEQEIMKEILLYEEEHEVTYGGADFRVTLWIHDGAAIHFTRRQKTHEEAMQERVEAKSRDLLGVPMSLEIEA